MGHSRGRRVLVVDDDEWIRSMLQRNGMARGYEMSCVADGKEALQRANDEHFDIILLDIMMPPPDGRDVLRALKTNERTREIPVIVFSGRADQVDRVAALEMGAYNVFEKSYDPRMLFRRIEQLLDKTTLCEL